MITIMQHLIRAIRSRLRPQDALASVAEAWLEQGATESKGSNAGPDVSWFIHDGGGTPSKRPPWCAYFVSSCCRQVARAGFAIEYVRTGRAVSHWIKAPPERQVNRDDIWDEPAHRGLIFVRTRMSKPETERQKVLDGINRQGHTGIVISRGVDDNGARTVTAVAGNSSGFGHNRVRGGGAVAKEVMTEGDESWKRLVGFVRVTPQPKDEA